MSWLEAENLGVGSKVVVKRAGDVIPRVTAALDADENADVPAWKPPSVCPECGGEWDKSSVLWRCHSPECAVTNRVAFFASRDCLDIEGLGDSVCEALVENGAVSNVADLYYLDAQALADLPVGTTSTGAPRLLGKTTANKILAAIEKSKTQPLNRVYTSLGIRMTGRSVGRWLAKAYPTMDSLRAATVDDIAQIEKLGTVKAQHIVDGIAGLSDVIDRMAAAGVNMGAEPVADGSPKPLAGHTYVVSGSVPGYSRTTIAEAIEAAGGRASSSVSKTTTALVTSETDTSKAQKAAALGIPIIDPSDFVKMLG